MKKHSYKDRSLIVDQCFTDSFDRMDLIEARVREAVFTAAEIATRLTALGVEACATIVSLNKDPVVSVYGFSLTIDEASDLIRRFDPKWNGQAYDRCWEGLPSDDFSLEKLEEDQKRREELEKLRQQSPPKQEPQEKKLPPAPPKRSRRLGGFPRKTHHGK